MIPPRQPLASVTASRSLTTPNLDQTYCGYLVTTATATGPVNVRVGSATGRIVDIIPAGTAAGSLRLHPVGIRCAGGIYVEFASSATGTLTIFAEA